MMLCRYITALLLAVTILLPVSAQEKGDKGESLKRLMELPPFERAILIIMHYETLHSPAHWPYIGYGHRVRKGEPYKKGVRLTERQADVLLRKDLKKRCATFRRFGRDSLLLADWHTKSARQGSWVAGNGARANWLAGWRPGKGIYTGNTFHSGNGGEGRCQASKDAGGWSCCCCMSHRDDRTDGLPVF